MWTERISSLTPATDLPRLAARHATSPLEASRGVTGQSWYEIRNASAAETEVSIYDEIGGWGITAAEFVNEFNGIKTPTITLRINSPGGDVFDGIAIYNAVKRHPATVNGFVDGIAASIASVIAMGCNTLTMMPHTQMMIHEAQGFAVGNADDMRKLADILERSSESIAAIYAEKCGLPQADCRQMMRDETWFSDREAVDAGLADKVDGDDAEPDEDPDDQLAAKAKASALRKPAARRRAAVKNDETPPATDDPVTDPPPAPEATAPDPVDDRPDFSKLFANAVAEAESLLDLVEEPVHADGD